MEDQGSDLRRRQPLATVAQISSCRPSRGGFFLLAGIAFEHHKIQSAYAMETDDKIATENKPLSLTGDSFPKIIVRHVDVIMIHRVYEPGINGLFEWLLYGRMIAVIKA